MITLCKTCGTSYAVTGPPPEQCDICEDERQYVPALGNNGSILMPFALRTAISGNSTTAFS